MKSRSSSSLLALSILALSVARSALAQCQKNSDLSWKHRPTLSQGTAARVIYNGLNTPRGVRWAENALLVIERGTGVVALVEGTDGCEGWTKSVVVQNGDLNHGLAIDGNVLYASTGAEVFRWDYDPSSRTVSGDETVIVTGMDVTRDHRTRTLELQPASGSSPQYIIVTAGSSENVESEAAEADFGTAQVRRFALNSSIPTDGYEWLDGELVAYGMRNAVGISLSPDGSHLWTVENSADDLHWQGTDVHIDNPSEEMNVVDLSDIGHYYGFPRCFTVWDFQSIDGGASFSTNDQFSISDDPSFDDEWCADDSNNVRPRLGFQAHSAPLDIRFYDAPDNTTYAVPSEFDGHAFVSFHGSWNRDPPTGYGIVNVPWSGDGPAAAADSRDGYAFILQAPDMSKCPDECIRPVGLSFDQRGRLFGSSDTTGEIFIIESTSSPDAVNEGGALSRHHISGLLLGASTLLMALLWA